MYGYRNGNGLMTNLDSISSSLSSIDTIGQRANIKASVDKLISSRSHSITSTSLLWKGNKANGNATRNNANSANNNNNPPRPGSEIYFSGGGRRNRLSTCCLNLETALNFLLVPLLLLVITRQVFDFLGQIWLQIIINFLTILLIIVALFGIRQRRLSYVGSFTICALFNTVWNLIVFCIHSKTRDVGITEDTLSFYTGSVSWWHANGPGCMPYNFNPSQPPALSIIQPNIIPGCRLDYHSIEAIQATVHGVLSFLAVLVSCCVASNIHRERAQLKIQQKKSFRLNNLTNDHAKVNQDPFPERGNPRYGNSASLRRAANQTGIRSSQHSVASTRRRNRQSESGVPTPRESVSSMHKSQKYGSLSSRRSNRKERRSEISSMTYGTTGAKSTGPRSRLSSMSSNDYLPSYQPPNSSNANLLSSYGEISSIDSYNNGSRKSRGKPSNKSMNRGNTNPTYNGSRSSVCSQNATNYDDLSYIYGNSSTRNESIYGASTSGADAARQKRQMYHQNRGHSSSKRNGTSDQYMSHPQKIHAETHREETYNVYQNGDAATNPKTSMQNGNLHSFTAPSNNSQIYTDTSAKMSDYVNNEVNNNHIMPNYHDELDKRANGTFKVPLVPPETNGRSRQAVDTSSSSSAAMSNQNNRIYSSQQRSRHPIYSNHVSNGNSETPI